jgi:hypothetical protein
VQAVLNLQRTAGNRAVLTMVATRGRRRLQRSPAQPAVLAPEPAEDAPVIPSVVRLEGAEEVYRRLTALEQLERDLLTPPLKSDTLPWEQPENQRRLEAARAGLDTELRAAGFDSAEQFPAAAAAFVEDFRRHAQRMTLTMLDASERVVMAEKDRYSRPEERVRLFADLATVRDAVSRELAASATSMSPFDLKREPLHPPQSQRRATALSVEQHGRGEAARQELIHLYPILADPELRTEALAVADPDALAPVLTATAGARLADIRATRTNIGSDPDLVFKWPRITDLTLEALQLDANSVHAWLVADHRQRIERHEQLVRAGWAALSIGFAALTFGGGALAGVAAVGGIVVSGAQAVDEWQRYQVAEAAAHTSFDAALAVSADDPSLAWVAVALLGVGLEGAGLAWAFKAAAPAARVLRESGGQFAAFETQIAQVTQLSPALRRELARAAAAEAKYQTSMAELAAAWRRSLTGQTAGFLGSELAEKAFTAAYYFVRNKAIAVKSYEAFEQAVRAQKFMKDVDFTDPTNVRDLRAAYARAVREVRIDRRIEVEALARGEWAAQDLAAAYGRRFFVTARYSDGAKTITFDDAGEMLLDGKPIAASKRNEVYSHTGVRHAVDGHGAVHDDFVIAQRSVQEVVGASSKFTTDEQMFRALSRANRALAQGRSVPIPGARRMVTELAPPGTGRAFALHTRVPSTAKIINKKPYPAVPDVVELEVTHVVAIYEADGSLVTIYPVGYL